MKRVSAVEKSAIKIDSDFYLKLSFQGNKIILDLSSVKIETTRGYRGVIVYLDQLLGEDKPEITRMSIWEQIGFLRHRKNPVSLIPQELEIVTLRDKWTASYTRLSFDGDMKYVSTKDLNKSDVRLMYIHQKLVQLYLKMWRNQVMDTAEKISNILRTMGYVQGISSILGFASFLIGLLNSSTKFLVLTLLPITIIGMLGIIKKYYL